MTETRPHEEQMLRVQIGKNTGDRSYLQKYCERVKGKVVIPDGVTRIGNSAFRYCRLSSVIIPNSVTSIGRNAFSDTHLQSIEIPDSVVTIEEQAFQFCDSLTSITIPRSVQSIGHAAFNGCTKLTSVTLFNSDIKIDSLAFVNCNNLFKIKIPKGTKQRFLKITGIKDLDGGEYMLVEDESLSNEDTHFKQQSEDDETIDADNIFQDLMHEFSNAIHAIKSEVENIFK